MMKTILLASVALVGMTGLALAGGGNFNVSNSHHDEDHGSSNTTVYNTTINNTSTDTHSITDTIADKTSRDNYNGIGTYTSAQHGGLIDAKTSGQAVGGAIQLNGAVANASGSQGALDLTASLNGQAGLSGLFGSNINANALGSGQIGGSLTGLNASSSAVSGSLAVGGAVGNSSSVVNTAGMAAGSSQAYKEWGNSVTNIHQVDHSWQNQNTFSGNTTYTPVSVSGYSH